MSETELSTFCIIFLFSLYLHNCLKWITWPHYEDSPYGLKKSGRQRTRAAQGIRHVQIPSVLMAALGKLLCFFKFETLNL